MEIWMVSYFREYAGETCGELAFSPIPLTPIQNYVDIFINAD